MIKLEPFDALALSLHHSPGVYALLVGSGLSHSAGIPTGWEITLDLIRRLAALEGVTEQNDWEAWFNNKHGKEPNYSEILDALASTPSERRAILHSYIEPSQGEETRRPTKAHHAIAKLVVDGTLRVILTTNFDRLIENALREAGIEPTVIASEDGLAGATPLVHTRCTVIKLHGDYLDTRIKNTDAELGVYAKGINSLLDEVLDRFGLIVVGWSGEWDVALRAALMRAPNRRYPPIGLHVAQSLPWHGTLSPIVMDEALRLRTRTVSSLSSTTKWRLYVRLPDPIRRASRWPSHWQSGTVGTTAMRSNGQNFWRLRSAKSGAT